MKVCLIESVMPSIELKLYHDRDKLIKDFDKQSINAYLPEAPAQTITTEIKDGSTVSFVLIEDDTDTYERQLALLCHEAVHVAQDYFERIGEKKPAIEEQAYVNHAVFQCLAVEHRKWLDKHKA